MRILAYSLNPLTAEFNAVAAGLRYAGHIVDVYRKRSFNDSLNGYTAALISLGDWTDTPARDVKLAAARAAATLSACYLFDHPPFRSNPEDFWRSAMFGEETPEHMIHRAEMLKVLKSEEWRPKIEEAVKSWNDYRTLPAIWPGRDWDPRPFLTPPDTSREMPVPASRKLSALFINKIRETALTR
jgi:hypothetical protein